MATILADRRTRLATSPLRHLDPILVLVPMIISALGIVMVYSSQRTLLEQAGDDPLYFAKHQAIAVVLGLVVMAAMIAIDYHKLRELALWGYGATVAGLFAVLIFGVEVKGAQARFDLGPLQVQPGEFIKLFLILVLAGYVAIHRGELNAKRIAISLAIAGLPMGLIMLEPDLGTDLVLMMIAFAILLVGGVKARHLVVLALMGITVATLAVNVGVLEEYQIDRLTSFADDGTDPSGIGYNQDQSQIAIGNGRFTGEGLFEGTQTQSAYVPEQHTDFIFTAVGEELGFVGSALLLGLFGLLVWRTWRAARLAQDRFGMLCCTGVLAMFVFQVFENIGMTMGIMPITGIPLPFMSYGGSSVVVSFACVGLVANVSMRRFS